MAIKLTILYDNYSRQRDLRSDWGFACLVEAGDRRILFDTGARGDILLENMHVLGVDAATIDSVVISHDHWDHTGGLAAFLSLNRDVTLHLPSSSMVPHSSARQVIIATDAPVDLEKDIHLTGLLGGIEQSLVMQKTRGTVVIVGCSHPGVARILEAAAPYGKPRGLIGGLHGFNDFDRLKELSLICPTHCTEYRTEIISRFPDRIIEGGAGTVIEIS